MKQVHIVIKRKWKIISLEDDLFQALWDKDVIRHTNCVYCFRPCYKNYGAITVNIPKGRLMSGQDITFVDMLGVTKCIL